MAEDEGSIPFFRSVGRFLSPPEAPSSRVSLALKSEFH